MELLKRGLQQGQVAAKLGIAYHTVHNLVTLMRRAGVSVPGRTNRSWSADDQETRAEARARVARELAEGVRCPQCWLLKPCDDHG